MVLGTSNTQTLYDSDIYYTLKTTGSEWTFGPNMIIPILLEESFKWLKCSHIWHKAI